MKNSCQIYLSLKSPVKYCVLLLHLNIGLLFFTKNEGINLYILQITLQTIKSNA